MAYKTYSELITLPDYKSRVEYLRTNSSVGSETFGSHRYLNQMLYKGGIWRPLRNKIIVRDGGCDLALPDNRIADSEPIIIHHLNPITIDDIINRNPKVFDPENLVCCSDATHKSIHYGNDILQQTPIIRFKDDTCPWKIRI